MEKLTLALLVMGFSMAAGCATSTEVRGSATVDARTAKVFATGPAVVHAYSLDRGGMVFLAPALTGTDADCAGGQNEGTAHATTVAVDRRNVVRVAVGEVACVTADRARPYELMWHAWRAPAPASNIQIATAR
jgi:hypothetical protein